MTLALLAAGEVCLRVNGDQLFAREARSFDGHFHLVERLVLRAGAPPEVLVMGDSRAMVAVLPRQLEAELERSQLRGPVANLGMPSGTPFDMWKLLERNPDATARVKVVVYFVDAFAWSAPGRVRSLGSVQERLAAEGPDALLPLAFRSHGARAQILEWIDDSLRGEAASRIELDAHGRAVDFEVSIQGPSDYYAPAAKQRASKLLRGYSPKPHQLASFLEIADWCEETGRTLVLLELPTRPEYEAAVAESFPGARDTYSALLEQLAERGLPVRKLTRAMLGLAPQDFHDADHLADSGAQKSTRFVAHALRAQLPPGL